MTDNTSSNNIVVASTTTNGFTSLIQATHNSISSLSSSFISSPYQPSVEEKKKVKQKKSDLVKG
jgi:hypothetical protein